MKLMSLAAPVVLVLASGSALSQQPDRDVRGDHSWGDARAGVPSVYLASTGTDWVRRVDFASASGTRSPVTWSPPLQHAGMSMPPAPLVLDTEDPLGPMPATADTGSAMAHNIATDDRLAQLNEVLAVPEPSALLMMLAGLGAIIFVIRRRLTDS